MTRYRLHVRMAVVAVPFLLLSNSFGLPSETKNMPVTMEQQTVRLKYRVTLSKPSYVLYEPTGVDLWVKNVSEEAVRIDRFPQHNGWIIWDENEKSYSTRKLHIDAWPPSFQLKPGDSLGGPAGLECYGVNTPSTGYPYDYLPVGEYAAFYKMGNDSLGPLRFKIVEPTGQEAEALKSYLSALSIVWNFRFHKASEKEKTDLTKEEVRKLEKVADRYPNSVYAMLALSRAANTAWSILSDHKLSYQINARLMRDYPESYHDPFEILKMYYENNRLGFRAELDSIYNNSSSLKLKAAAKKALNQLEREK